MNGEQPGAWIADLSWPEVQQRITQGACAWLPVGAAAKEHGPHLPMSADLLQAEWLTNQMIMNYPLLAWPAITYGYYPAFVRYPGSSHINKDTFARLAGDIVDGILAQGLRKVMILNTGISTRDTLEGLAARRPRVVLINAYSGPRCSEVSTQVLERGPGGHADERETSILLAIDPRRVALELAPGRDQANIGPGPLQWQDPAARNYSPSGIIGDARGASAEKGKRILAAILDDLATTVTRHL